MLKANDCYKVFEQSIEDYHKSDNVDAVLSNPYQPGTFESLLYFKNWIDTVQWHLEDIIRLPTIDPVEGMLIKRRIDKSNQERTDMVEKIDDYFLDNLSQVNAAPSSRINSETPAWLLDRMSILLLKVYHMREQAERQDVDAPHRAMCQVKLGVLMEQRYDMEQAFDELIEDISRGKRRFKVYRQLKMYNDATLNPMLYGKGRN